MSLVEDIFTFNKRILVQLIALTKAELIQEPITLIIFREDDEVKVDADEAAWFIS